MDKREALSCWWMLFREHAGAAAARLSLHASNRGALSWGSLESMDQDYWGQESTDSPIFEYLLDLWLDLYPESMPTIELITQ